MSENRTKQLLIRVSEEEMEFVDKKFSASGCKSKSEFIRKMILEGMIVYVNEDTLDDFRYKLSTISNNTNQIAKKANATGHVYDEEIREIQEGVDDLRQQLRSFLSPLQNPRHLPISQVLKKQETEN